MAKLIYPQMSSWDATWNQHHVPAWMRRRIRGNQCKFEGGYEYHVWGCKGWSRPFKFKTNHALDHYGSIIRDGVEVFVNQPYGEDNDAAREWAEILGCKVEMRDKAPWAPGTFLYLFSPSQA